MTAILTNFKINRHRILVVTAVFTYQQSNYNR